jgi:hypothetical protein
MKLYRVLAVILLARVVVACAAPPHTDVKTARDARYNGDTAEIFRALVEAVGTTYPLQAVDTATFEIRTVDASYESDGTILGYSIVLTPTVPHRVQVLTHVTCENGDDPAWVGARTESLILAIHERLAAWEVSVTP